MIIFLHGDMWAINATIRVNTVNCVGTMGKGVALDFKKRYPLMYKDYKDACKEGLIEPGWMQEWYDPISKTTIINFPTKRHWRENSRYEDIETGLQNLRLMLMNKPWTTITIPALGCGNGGLDWDVVKPMITTALDCLDHKILVFEPLYELRLPRPRRHGK